MKKIFKFWRIFVIVIILASSSYSGNLDNVLQQRVSPTFMGVTLKDAVRMFAQQYHFNYVFSGQGKGVVNVRLTNIPLGEALEYMLKPNGYHFLLKDNVLIIKPLKENFYGERQTKIYQLQYVDGIKIKNTLKTFLSEKGRIEALLTDKQNKNDNERSNILIVSDLPENLKIIDQVIKELDKPEKQVQIEVRLIETLLGGEDRVGIKWPTSISTSVMGAETTAPINKGQQAGGGQQTVLSAWYKLPNTINKLNLGVLTLDKLRATLELLAQDNESKLVSNPKIVTLNNHRAIIRIGTTVPVPQIERGFAGDLFSYKEKDVSMRLEVIPVVGEDNQITLKLHPVMQEIIGYTGPAEAPQPIVSIREVETSVVIKDGETVAIGGLVKATTNVQKEKIWLLGNIPILGYLFTHTSKKKEKKDLLIFITSKIIGQ